MKLKSYLSFVAICGVALFSSCSRSELTDVIDPAQRHGGCGNQNVYLPGEWEEQSSVWMGWPTYENKAGLPTEYVQAQMIKALAPHVKIDMAVQDQAEIMTAKSTLLSYGVSMATINSRIRFRIIPHNDIWWRDMGGVFLVKENNNGNDTHQLIDFNFNGWGYGPYTDAFYQGGFDLEETVDREMADKLNISTIPTSMILEGGAVECNGKGTIIVAESVVFQRNPNMTKAMATAELKRIYKAKKVIWLPRGVGNDVHAVLGSPYVINGENVYTPVTTNGHTDEFVRFVDEHTILLANIPAAEATDTIARYSRKALLEAENILSNATDQDGNPFTIIHFPEVGTILEEVQAGDGTFDFLSSLSGLNIDPDNPIKVVLAASYLNYVISNGVVLVPKYARPGRPSNLATKDAQAVQILQSVFPGRQIVQIDATNINLGGGGMHCITQQVPKL